MRTGYLQDQVGRRSYASINTSECTPFLPAVRELSPLGCEMSLWCGLFFVSPVHCGEHACPKVRPTCFKNYTHKNWIHFLPTGSNEVLKCKTLGALISYAPNCVCQYLVYLQHSNAWTLGGPRGTPVLNTNHACVQDHACAIANRQKKTEKHSSYM